MTGCAKDMYKYRLLIFHGQTDLLPEDHIKLSGLATSATCERNQCAFDTPLKPACRAIGSPLNPLPKMPSSMVNLQCWALRVAARFQNGFG